MIIDVPNIKHITIFLSITYCGIGNYLLTGLTLDKVYLKSTVLWVQGLIDIHSNICHFRGGWKCGYITCAILRRSRIWYDWSVNNVPCFACHHMLDEILRWLEVFYHCWWRLKSDHINLAILDCGDLYIKFFSSQWRQTTRLNLGHPLIQLEKECLCLCLS